MGNITYPKVSQGAAKLVSEDDIIRDDAGFTHPNLHRRVDPQIPSEDSQEHKPREYKLGISNVNSYRTTEIHYHDEESTTSEIP